MQKLVFKREEIAGKRVYRYSILKHGLSASNMLSLKIMRFLLNQFRDSIDAIEVEYSDFELAKKVGIQRARQILELLGSDSSELIENKKDEVVISRTMIAPISEKKLNYFYTLLDLRELPRYQFLADSYPVITVEYGDIIQFSPIDKEDQGFFQELDEMRVAYGIEDINAIS